MAPRATVTLPPASAGANRTLYYYRGGSLAVNTQSFRAGMGLRLVADQAVTLLNGEKASELLLLQGQPISEPVVKRGPFVMNSQTEIQRAYTDYRATQFGGWPWSDSAPVHAREKRRFAVHADGRI